MITPAVTISAERRVVAALGVPRRAGRLHPSPLTCESAGEAGRVLHRGTLVYVAIGTTGGPLVTPVLYGVTGDRVWFLTNRHALKAKVLRRDPRAAWVVSADGRAAFMTGVARLFSPLHPIELLAAAPRLPQEWQSETP